MDTFETMQKADLVAHYPEAKVTVACSVKAHTLAQKNSTSLAKADKVTLMKNIALQASHLLVPDNHIVTRFLNLGIVVAKLGGGCECHGMVLYICCQEDVTGSNTKDSARMFNDTRDFHFENVSMDAHGDDKTPFTTWGAKSTGLN